MSIYCTQHNLPDFITTIHSPFFPFSPFFLSFSLSCWSQFDIEVVRTYYSSRTCWFHSIAFVVNKKKSEREMVLEKWLPLNELLSYESRVLSKCFCFGSETNYMVLRDLKWKEDRIKPKKKMGKKCCCCCITLLNIWCGIKMYVCAMFRQQFSFWFCTAYNSIRWLAACLYYSMELRYNKFNFVWLALNRLNGNCKRWFLIDLVFMKWIHNL